MKGMEDWVVKLYGDRIFDIWDRGNWRFITDYSHLDKELIPCDEWLKIRGEKERIVINSINSLRDYFKEIIFAVIQTLQTGNCFNFDINESEKEMLINQLVFDILFDKYCSESEWMTRASYSKRMAEKLFPGNVEGYRAINEAISRGMKNCYEMMKNPSMREQIRMLGCDPEMYDKYNTPHMRENISKKKPKYSWDCYYYNYGDISITSRIFRRQFTRENRNYPYKDTWEDLKEYDCFVNKLLPAENESCQKYYYMSMDYFYLESYKRIDFILKLVSMMPKDEMQKIDKQYFLVKRFHPQVLVPFVQNDKVCFDIKYNYYRPLFMIEQSIQEQMHEDKDSDFSKYGNKLINCQIIRAKAYELFEYHAQYISSDYREIKSFISQSYNMKMYHESNDIWKAVRNEKWKNIDSDRKKEFKKNINDIQTTIKSLFWDSPDRKIIRTKDEE